MRSILAFLAMAAFASAVAVRGNIRIAKLPSGQTPSQFQTNWRASCENVRAAEPGAQVTITDEYVDSYVFQGPSVF